MLLTTLRGICRSPAGVFIASTPTLGWLQALLGPPPSLCKCVFQDELLLGVPLGQQTLSKYARKEGASDPPPAGEKQVTKGADRHINAREFSGNPVGFRRRGRRRRQLSGGRRPRWDGMECREG